jgi:hypothetical protein
LDFLCRAPRHSPLHATGKLRTHFNDASEVCPQFVMAAKMLKENIKIYLSGDNFFGKSLKLWRT